MPFKKLEDRIANSRSYYLRNKERILKRFKERRENAKLAASDAATRKRWQRENKPRVKGYDRKKLLKSYGLTQEMYDAILESQGGICALCSKDDPKSFGKRLNIDHDHKTGVVRGLLCNGHNTSLGKFGDCIEGLERAIAYIRRSFPGSATILAPRGTQ